MKCNVELRNPTPADALQRRGMRQIGRALTADFAQGPFKRSDSRQ